MARKDKVKTRSNNLLWSITSIEPREDHWHITVKNVGGVGANFAPLRVDWTVSTSLPRMSANLEFVSDSLANPGEEIHLRFRLFMEGETYGESCDFSISYSTWPVNYTESIEYVLRANLPALKK